MKGLVAALILVALVAVAVVGSLGPARARVSSPSLRSSASASSRSP